MTDLFDRLPKYIQIKEALRKDIEEGALSEGQQLASEADLIRKFGASKMTVIRALQELVQEGYLKRIQGRGTYVTKPADLSQLIGVLVPGTDRGIFSILLQIIEQEAHRLGYHMMLCSTDEDCKKAEAFAKRLVCRHAAGVIAAPMERTFPSRNCNWYGILHDARIPVVLMDRDIKGVEHTIVVETNNEDAMAELTREVVLRGHRRILLAQWKDVQSPTIANRIAGFQKVANRGKYKVDLAQVVSVCDRQPFLDSVEKFNQLLAKYDPTVIMCINDHIALHVMTLLKHVKGDAWRSISVTGFDDQPFAEWINLTTVHQPLEEVGKSAVQLLHDQVQGGKAASRVLPSHVVLRSSLMTLNDLLKESFAVSY